jgi:hypothetical protein
MPLILLGQSIAGIFLLWMVAGWVFPFTTDSILYITTAQNIAHFKGLLSVNLFVQPAAPDVLPLHLTPPGYPIAIAILKWCGINEYAAALILPRVCFLSLPFLFYFIFKRFFSSNGSRLVSGICALSFTVLECSVIAWSDIPYLALSLLVLIMVFNIIEQKTLMPWSYIMLAGVLSGTAFLIRYAGVSLIISVGMCFIVMGAVRMVPFKDVIRAVVFYGLGAVLPIVPYCLRNLVVFGVMNVNPSSIPPDQFYYQLMRVVELYFKGLSSIIFGVDSGAVIILIILAGLGAWVAFSFKNLIERSPATAVCLVLLLLYFFIYSIFLIYNKSLAFLPGNPDIDGRVMVPIFWILLGGIAAALKDRKVVAGILIFIFILIQIFSLARFYQKQTQIKALAGNIGQHSFKGVPADYVIVSNVPEITYYFTKRNTRGLSNYTPLSLLYNLQYYRKFCVFLVKGCGQLSPAWVYAQEWNNPDGYKRVYSDEQVDLLVPQVIVGKIDKEIP